MVNIGEEMANDDLDSLKFLLSKILLREKMEKAQVRKITDILFCFHLLSLRFLCVWEGNFGVISLDTEMSE